MARCAREGIATVLGLKWSVLRQSFGDCEWLVSIEIPSVFACFCHFHPLTAQLGDAGSV